MTFQRQRDLEVYGGQWICWVRPWAWDPDMTVEASVKHRGQTLLYQWRCTRHFTHISSFVLTMRPYKVGTTMIPYIHIKCWSVRWKQKCPLGLLGSFLKGGVPNPCTSLHLLGTGTAEQEVSGGRASEASSAATQPPPTLSVEKLSSTKPVLVPKRLGTAALRGEVHSYMSSSSWNIWSTK